MKKFILTFSLIFIAVANLFGQDVKVSLDKITTDEKLFTGRIDGQYEITLYLKFHEFSPEHGRIYSLSGWYYYDKIKTKIPLVGIYDGTLTLYVFKSKEKQDTVLNFKKEGKGFWNDLQDLKNMEGFDEKFIYSNDVSDIIGEWISGTKSLNLEIFGSDISVYNEAEYLKIQNSSVIKSVKIYDLGIFDREFTLVNYISSKNGTKILLKYDYLSNLFVNGMCGAGEEIGYIVLKYDNSFILTDKQRVEIESCYNGTYSEAIKGTNKDVKTYKVTDKDNKTKKVTINEKTVEVKIEE